MVGESLQKHPTLTYAELFSICAKNCPTRPIKRFLESPAYQLIKSPMDKKQESQVCASREPPHLLLCQNMWLETLCSVQKLLSSIADKI